MNATTTQHLDAKNVRAMNAAVRMHPKNKLYAMNAMPYIIFGAYLNRSFTYLVMTGIAISVEIVMKKK
jgi:hypothetical protein